MVLSSKTIYDENHYYAYGLEMTGSSFINATGNGAYTYKFNGIERTEGIGLNIDIALYRGLDPVLGKWYQVDPKAEQAGYGMSPYCAMGNNPVSYADPDGDIPFFIIPQIGYSISGGLSLGLEIGIGVPGVLSASVTGGVNLGQKVSCYWSVQGSAGGFYAGYGSSGGFAGWGYRYAGFSGGLSYNSEGWGVGVSLGGSTGSFNAALGVGWSQGGGWDFNVSGGYTYLYTPKTGNSQVNSSGKGGVQSQGEINNIIKKLSDKYQMTPEQLREALAILAESYKSGSETVNSYNAVGDNYKCSHFVYDLAVELGMLPPGSKVIQAGTWGSKSSIIPGFEKVYSDFQRGDIVGYYFKTKNATGHVGIMINSGQLLYASPKGGLRLGSIKKWPGKPTWVGNRYIGQTLIILFFNNFFNLYNDED